MEQIKPYAFWIVCGVLLVVELVLVAMIDPTDERGRSVETVVNSADREFRSFKNDHERAEAVLQYTRKDGDGDRDAPVPAEAISPENEEKVNEFLEKYLIHGSWKDSFLGVTKAYKDQLRDIEELLRTSSEPLHEPIGDPQASTGVWYASYLGETVGLMRQMRQAGRVSLGEGVPTQKQLEENSAFRSTFGFHTKPAGGAFPNRDEIPQLTERFHVSEQLCRLIMGLKVVGAPNPRHTAVEDMQERQPDPAAPFGVELRSVEWGGGRGYGSGGGITGILPGAEGAEVAPCTVVLRGPPAALAAFGTKIDNLRRPLILRTGSSWRRIGVGRSSFRSTTLSSEPGQSDDLGRRSDVVEMELQLVYLDFANMQSPLRGLELATSEGVD